MKGVILAAGEGLRLEPLTERTSKVMTRFLGKPLLYYHLKNFKEAGIKEVAVVISPKYKKETTGYIKKNNLGLKIHVIIQEKSLGPADAIYHVKKIFLDGPTIILYGDSLTDENIIKQVLDNYEPNEGYSMFVTASEVEEPSHYGIFKFDSNKNVIDIIEKPKREEAPSNLGFQGCFIIDLSVFYKAFEEVGEKDQKIKEETHCMKYMMKKGKVGHWISENNKIDIGRPWNILEGNKVFLDKVKKSIHSSVRINKTAIIKGEVVIEEGTVIYENAVIKGPVYIGKNCIIGTSSLIRPYSSIEDECVIGGGSEVKNSSIFKKTAIGHHSFVGDSVIGSNCLIGAHFITANYRLDGKNVEMYLKGKKKDTGRKHFGCVIGDDTKIACGTIVYPGRKIGCSCLIDSGIVVKKNIASNKILKLKQELEEKDA